MVDDHGSERARSRRTITDLTARLHRMDPPLVSADHLPHRGNAITVLFGQ